MSELEVRDLTVEFDSGGYKVRPLDNLSFDADDGELTRTQKVRRRFIAERYAPLVEGLYNGATEASISAEIVFEDGRKTRLEGKSRIYDMTPHPVVARSFAA